MFKKIIKIFGAVFVILIIIGIAASNNVVDTTGSGNVTISLEEYNKIKTGMTYEEVQRIVGGPGVITSESHTDGIAGVMEDIDIIIVSYNGEGQHFT